MNNPPTPIASRPHAPVPATCPRREPRRGNQRCRGTSTQGRAFNSFSLCVYRLEHEEVDRSTGGGDTKRGGFDGGGEGQPGGGHVEVELRR